MLRSSSSHYGESKDQTIGQKRAEANAIGKCPIDLCFDSLQLRRGEVVKVLRKCCGVFIQMLP